MGATAATTRLLVCAVDATPAAFAALVARVDGANVPLEVLDRFDAARYAACARQFKLGADEASDPERAILTRLAAKDLVK